MTTFLEEAEAELSTPVQSFRIEGPKMYFEALFDKAISAIPSKDLLPVLKNFLVVAEDPEVQVVATDLELSVIADTQSLQVKHSGSKRIVIPAKKMMEILAQTGEGVMTIEATEDEIIIMHEKSTWQLRRPSGEDFPPLPDVKNVNLHTIERKGFISGIQGVRYAASTTSVRPSLQMIDITNGKVTACDGVRLQQVFLGETFPMNLQIPINAVEDLTKLLTLNDQLEEIQIGESDNHLVFRVGSDTFLLNKLTVSFAPVEELMLKSALLNKEQFSVNRQALLAAVKRVRITADSDISSISLELAPQQVTVTAQDAMGNLSWEVVDALYENERTLILNHFYLADMLSMYDGETCTFYLGTDTKTKKSVVLLKDEVTLTFGVINQMKRDWLT